MDLDQGVDEILCEAAACRRVAVETGRELGDDDVAVDVVHHVERHAEQRFVLAHRADRRHADALLREGELETRLADDIVRRGR